MCHELKVYTTVLAIGQLFLGCHFRKLGFVN